jgi:hypothetical protein
VAHLLLKIRIFFSVPRKKILEGDDQMISNSAAKTSFLIITHQYIGTAIDATNTFPPLQWCYLNGSTSVNSSNRIGSNARQKTGKMIRFCAAVLAAPIYVQCSLHENNGAAIAKYVKHIKGKCCQQLAAPLLIV